MSDTICQTTDWGLRCPMPAEWFIAGKIVTPHPCCDRHKKAWESKTSITASPIGQRAADMADLARWEDDGGSYG